MRIAVFGTGGAGGYFGARLAQAGNDVVFIARGAHLQAIRERGLIVESIKGNFKVFPAQATDDPEQVGAVDAVILGVKTWQVAEAAEAIKPLLSSESFVVPLQNGVDAPDQLVQVLGTRHIVGGLARIISFIAAPGCIRHTGGIPYIAFGELDNSRSERVERLHQAFVASGEHAEIPPDINAAMWAKFLFVVPVGGVGAVTRSPIGVFRRLPGTRALLSAAMEEIEALARAGKIKLSEDIVRVSLGLADSLPTDGTSSLQRDLVEGRRTELDAWTGAVVRLGKELGIPTPVNEFIYYALLPQELRARGELAF